MLRILVVVFLVLSMERLIKKRDSIMNHVECIHDYVNGVGSEDGKIEDNH